MWVFVCVTSSHKVLVTIIFPVQADDDIRPAKLTQRDSGLADSIEPDSTESRRQSVTPDVRATSPEPEEERVFNSHYINKIKIVPSLAN